MSALKGIEIFSYESFIKPLELAQSRALTKYLQSLENEINKTVVDTFFVPQTPKRFSYLTFRKQKNRIVSAELWYKIVAIPLSRYPVKQYRITTGNRILGVSRNSSTSKFKQKIVSRAYIRTDVRIRRKGSWKTVHGTKGFMGWLHTGRKKGESDYYGNPGKILSSNIYERNQQPTWMNGERLPIHRLFGPSVAQLTQTKEVQAVITKSFNSPTLDNIFAKEL